MEKSKPLKGKPVSFSATDSQLEIVFPRDLNPNNQVAGEWLFGKMDVLAAKILRFHSGMNGVTLGFDHGKFVSRVKQGDLLILRGAINHVWRTSCEIGIKVFLLDQTQEEWECIPVTHCYFTYVSCEFDDQGKPKPIPPVVPKTSEQKRRFGEADQRRVERFQREQKSPA